MNSRKTYARPNATTDATLKAIAAQYGRDWAESLQGLSPHIACTSCGDVKPLPCFSADRDSPLGVAYACHACANVKRADGNWLDSRGEPWELGTRVHGVGSSHPSCPDNADPRWAAVMKWEWPGWERRVKDRKSTQVSAAKAKRAAAVASHSEPIGETHPQDQPPPAPRVRATPQTEIDALAPLSFSKMLIAARHLDSALDGIVSSFPGDARLHVRAELIKYLGGMAR